GPGLVRGHPRAARADPRGRPRPDAAAPGARHELTESLRNGRSGGRIASMVIRNTSTTVRALLLNNLVAALIASAVMIVLHEGAHLVTGLALGHPSILYAFGVDHLGSPSDSDQVVMLLAGPAFSLITGVLMQRWTPLRRRGD